MTTISHELLLELGFVRAASVSFTPGQTFFMTEPHVEVWVGECGTVDVDVYPDGVNEEHVRFPGVRTAEDLRTLLRLLIG